MDLLVVLHARITQAVDTVMMIGQALATASLASVSRMLKSKITASSPVRHAVSDIISQTYFA